MEVTLSLDCLNIPQAATGEDCGTATVKIEQDALLSQRFQKGEYYTSFEEFIGILQDYQQQNNVFFVRESAERVG